MSNTAKGMPVGPSVGHSATPARVGFLASVRAWWNATPQTMTINGNGGAVGVGSRGNRNRQSASMPS